jgi:hypothetical protein
MGSLLAHPELLQALPTLVSALGPLMRSGGSGTASAGGPGGIAAGKAPGGEGRPGGGFPPDRHTPLLKALKPYLGPERRQALETMIQLCQVWDSLQHMGVSLLPPAANSRDTRPSGPSGKEER